MSFRKPRQARREISSTTCLGSESYSVTNVSGVTYAWAVSSGGTITSSGNPATAIWTTAGTYTITVTPSNACGNGTSRTLAVIVYPNPPTPQITPSGNTTFCAGDSVVLSSDSATTYLWNTSDTTQSIIATTQGNYTVTITDVNGCSAASQPTNITVNALPIANAGNDATFCNTDSAMLSASGGISYSWSPATGLSCTNCQNPYASPTSTTTYTVTVTNASGCTAMDSAIVNIVTVLTANAGYDSSICSGESTTLNASGGTGFSWSPTAGLNNPNIANPVASPTTTTTYNVIVTSGTCPPASDSVLITVNPNPPVPTITKNGLTLMSSSATGNQWFFNGDTILNATSQFYIVTQNGFYTVEVTNSYGCSSISSAFSVVDVGINEFSVSDFMNIYPNPSEGCFTLEYTGYNSNQGIEIVIYNRLGSRIYHSENFNQKTLIDLSKQPKGIYLVRLLLKNNITADKKIIIQ